MCPTPLYRFLGTLVSQIRLHKLRPIFKNVVVVGQHEPRECGTQRHGARLKDAV